MDGVRRGARGGQNRAQIFIFIFIFKRLLTLSPITIADLPTVLCDLRPLSAGTHYTKHLVRVGLLFINTRGQTKPLVRSRCRVAHDGSVS